MKRWLSALVSDLIRSTALFAGVLALGGAIDAVFVGGAGLLALLSGSTLLASLGIGLLAGVIALPGAGGIAFLGPLLLPHRWIDPRRGILREVAADLGLGSAIDLPEQLVAAGRSGDRPLRIQYQPLQMFGVTLAHRVSVSVGCRSEGYAQLVSAGRGLVPAEGSWEESLARDPSAAGPLALLVHDAPAGRGVFVLPGQLHARGGLEWLEDASTLRARIDAVAALACAVEQQQPPPTEAGWSLRTLARVLPKPGAIQPWLTASSAFRTMAILSLAAMSVLWLFGCAAIVTAIIAT